MNYKVELIVKVREGRPLKSRVKSIPCGTGYYHTFSTRWIIDAITDQLYDGEEVLDWDITKIED